MPDNSAKSVLNVADIDRASFANGPGRRFVIWVQGCPFRCHGCSNPDFLPFRPANPFTVGEIFEQIMMAEGVEGVTFSGGEPMSHASALSVLAERVQSVGLSIVCFSGYTLEEIRLNGDPYQLKLLSHIDVLIDGRYNNKLPGGGLTGSANQKIHCLSDVYDDGRHGMRQRKTIELMSGPGVLRATGVFETPILNRLHEVLREGPHHLISLDEKDL